MGSMRLLEEVCTHGSVRPTAAVDVVRDLAEQMSHVLKTVPETTEATFRMLPNAKPAAIESKSETPNSGGLPLRLVDDLRIGEMMVKMSIITQEQCDRVLRAQAGALGNRKRFGDLCVELGILSKEAAYNAIRMQHRESGKTSRDNRTGSDAWGDRPL